MIKTRLTSTKSRLNQVTITIDNDLFILSLFFKGLTPAQFSKLDADMLLMSPPCQPFTRQGLQGDSQDARTKSFFYIMDMLPR